MQLPMDPTALPGNAVLLFDTTVYIDQAKPSGLPLLLSARIAASEVRHARLCISELAFGYGNLVPGHPASARNRTQVQTILGRIAETAIVDLSAAGWAKAGALAGILARTQGLARDQRREMLLAAALFVTAQAHRVTLVSANLRHMDLLLQIAGPASVLLYALPQQPPRIAAPR